MPTQCPKKYLPVKTELTFAGLGGLPEQKVLGDLQGAVPQEALSASPEPGAPEGVTWARSEAE